MIILGSTGSIGAQALTIAKSANLNIECLCAGDNIALLNAQIAEFRPKIVVIKNSANRHLVRGAKTLLCGESGIIEALNLAESQFVLNALVGFSGVAPTLEAIKLNKTLALANKESLVVAGFLIPNLARIIPVDSEHFALNEILKHTRSVKKLLITASGGAFRDLPLNEIPTQTPRTALNHPTWSMGQKITIDSATMINKIFEILEAKWLFGGESHKSCESCESDLRESLGESHESTRDDSQDSRESLEIDAIIERNSTIHALVETHDNAILAHFSSNDMKLPISRAILGESSAKKSFINALDLMNLNIRFEEISANRYPLWRLKSAVLQNPKIGIAINAANDALVARFLKGEILFGKISEGIFNALERFEHESLKCESLGEICELHTKIQRFLLDF